MDNSQLTVIGSTLVIFLLSVLLARSLVLKYIQKKASNKLFWALGMCAFALGTLLQLVFALGIYADALMGLYLFIVVALVQLFSVGSIQNAKSTNIKRFYEAFAFFTALLTLYSIAVSGVANMLIGYVVGGLPSNFIIIASSIATFPAALVIIVMAAIDYLKTKSKKLLSVIAGVLVVSIAGTLYIAAFPELLYFAELLGVVLLWIGFAGGKKG